MKETMTFGQWLKQRRKALDLTQKALAARVGCAAVTILKIEAATLRPSRQIAELLAAALELTPEEQVLFVEWARADALAAPPDPVVLASKAFPAAAPAQWGPGSGLPVPPTPLLGRALDVARVRTLLWRVDVRLVVLTGPPGIGKTRLAIQVAAEVRDDFADGVIFVGLAQIRSPALAATALAQALGLPPGRQAPVAQLQDALRDKQLLLLLDNFEQIVA